MRYGNVSAFAIIQHKKDNIKYNVLISIISVLIDFWCKFTIFSRIIPFLWRYFPLYMIKKPEFCNRKTKNVALSKAKAHFTFLHKRYNITCK